MRADGSDQRNLTNTPDVDELYPQASPDGRWIAFCRDSERDGARERSIWRMRADGSDRQLIATDARDPFWSPAGDVLGYLPDEFPDRFSYATWATKGIAIHDLATGATIRHPNPDLRHLYSPQWIDDRWLLATVHGGLGYLHAIVLIERTGDEIEKLNVPGCRPDLAGDHRRLTWGYGETSLGAADLDLASDPPSLQLRGRIVRNSPGGDHTYHVDWSPDARFVAYASGPPDRTRRLNSSVMPQCPGVTAPGWDIWVADSSGTNLRVQLTTCGSSNKEPEWIRAPDAAGDKTGDGDR